MTKVQPKNFKRMQLWKDQDFESLALLDDDVIVDEVSPNWQVH